MQNMQYKTGKCEDPSPPPSPPSTWARELSVLAPRPLARVDRQVAVGHLEDDQCHARRVVLAEVAAPGAAVALTPDQLVADAGVPRAPVVAAGEEHRLHGVVVAVKV